ncbi:grasp-with-spasm system ATP-grasp peptide maturase [Flavobacterium terrae]|uniref:ATP-GRASP peptide maturase, grasp-with-spasm system n=1 Tax=Flavobacterium terrae TaxID=415425 RepID=A0A1M6BAM1_9FLAO|nr:grasp-with-spasm system ATP-grasp peptide maturase [Flavobacterium terrae]SHI45503.1 ATP-GRASP peptide maturase, grasp-with-spasm system [Flavobacterium terrae]
MILIITEEADYSSSMVINWLLYYRINFIRINENDELHVECLLNDFRITNNSFNFLLSEIKGMWYRRGFLNIKIEKSENEIINNFKKAEFAKLKQYIYYKLSLLPNINSFTNSDVNKLVVNDIASEIGIITPQEYILSSKDELLLLDDLSQYATKSISGSAILDFGNFYTIGYTSLLNITEEYSKFFFPSLIQKYIKKKYELRIFFLHDQFYTMAIFSQRDETTRVDFRNYNRKNPNRNVPFELPIEIKVKLINLMNRLKLNSGSIDMIVTPNNEYVFLEVNPIGQYGMVSVPCNYYLDMKIANFFKNNTYE